MKKSALYREFIEEERVADPLEELLDDRVRNPSARTDNEPGVCCEFEGGSEVAIFAGVVGDFECEVEVGSFTNAGSVERGDTQIAGVDPELPTPGHGLRLRGCEDGGRRGLTKSRQQDRPCGPRREGMVFPRQGQCLLAYIRGVVHNLPTRNSACMSRQFRQSMTPSRFKAGPSGIGGLRIVQIPARDRVSAARRLLGPNGGDATSARRMIASARDHGIDLRHMWASYGESGTGPGQVCLAVPGQGRSAMIFVSHPLDAGEEQALSLVIDHACRGLEGINIFQALLEPHEQAAQRAAHMAGFRNVGTLLYLIRDIPRSGEMESVQDWPEGVRVRRYRHGDDPALIRALDMTYEGTLDCPELCGLRRTEDVLASHRAAGEWDPALWWVVERAGRIEGMMLFNPSHEMDAVELVYVGLAPALRGKGLGHRLLRHGLSWLPGLSLSRVTCAVDERNEPARRVYRRLGFVEATRRVALVRPAGARG